MDFDDEFLERAGVNYRRCRMAAINLEHAFKAGQTKEGFAHWQGIIETLKAMAKAGEAWERKHDMRGRTE